MNTDTWVLIADSSRGRLFSAPQKRKPWSLIREFTHAASRQSNGDLTSAQAGRTQNPAPGGATSALESKTSPKEVEFERFAQELAGVLHDGHGQQYYKRIVLVAPPHFLGLLRQNINPIVSKLIGATLDKDYMHLNQDEVHKHVDGLIWVAKSRNNGSQSSRRRT